MVRDITKDEKNEKGWAFSNTLAHAAQRLGLSREASEVEDLIFKSEGTPYGTNAIVPFGPTTNAPPSG